jgi:2'-phosphotransferase
VLKLACVCTGNGGCGPKVFFCSVPWFHIYFGPSSCLKKKKKKQALQIEMACQSYSKRGHCSWGKSCWFSHDNMTMTLRTQDNDSAHETVKSREYEESYRKRKFSSSLRVAAEAVAVEAAKALKRQKRFGGGEPCPKKQGALPWHSEERDVQRAVVINPEEEGEEEAVEEEEEEEEEEELQDNNSRSRMNIISKKLCKILRHDAVKLGLKIRADGFCELDEVLRLRAMQALGVSRTEVEHVNRTNNKKRFDMRSSLEGKRLIRAVQGHSMNEVKDSSIHEKLSLASRDLPVQCVHGTHKEHVISILMNGLITGGMQNNNRWNQTRNHIHFREHHGEWLTSRSFSSMRPDKDTIFCINLHEAMRAGIEFLRSKNGIILTRGEAGVLAPKYLTNLMYRGAGEEFISLQ